MLQDPGISVGPVDTAVSTPLRIPKGLKATFWVVRARRVDVDIDDIDAAFRLVEAVAGVPRSIA